MRKKANNKLSYMKRGIPGLFLSSNEKFYAARMEKLYKKALILLLSAELDSDEKSMMIMIAKIAKRRYKSAVEKGDINVTSSPSLGRTIDSFEVQQFWSFFRFTKDDLKRLKEELLFDDEYIFDNRTRMSGEEVFLRGLYELSSGENQFKIAELVKQIL